ncbi:sugar transferase [Actinomadura logoneensis]|uniref:Sugar transferase n=1 Tax=Actinomadura logoneensis TaxID=2293572 RepID=A0A372JKV6_9ACTN|nr:sugar transferase [Actinomadura logoneensis]RFU40661.1 sugar transferase [Actinomadura logoneensis]
MAVMDGLRSSEAESSGAARARSEVQQWTRAYQRAAVALDASAMLAGAGAAFAVRFPGIPDEEDAPYLAFTAMLPVFWLVALALCRAYRPRYTGVGYEEFHRVLRAGFLLVASVAMLSYAFKIEIARGYVAIALPLGVFLCLVARFRLRKRLHKRRWKGECMRRVVAVGHRAALSDLIRLLRQKRYHGMDVVAVCLPPDDTGGPVRKVPVAGDFGQVAEVVDRVGADSVAVLACPEMDGVALRRLAWQIERDDVELAVAPALMDVAGPRISIRPVSGLPLLHVEHPELDGVRKALKSLLDKVGAGLGLLVLSPLLLAVAVAVKATDRGPVLFRQVRVGRGGRPFTVLKFRTMVVDAEHRKAGLLDENEHDGVLFKMRSDPRVTPVGRLLRRYSLDELPQLINVLRGEMSLVGPRPPLPDEVARYGGDVYRRLVVRPGLTGLWQVSGRSDLSWEESVRLDLRYVDNWSLAMDLQIMWKTWSAVFRGSGAY